MSGMRTSCGVDLGQAADPSAVAVVEVHRQRTLSGVELPSHVHVVDLQRWEIDLSYHEQVRRLRVEHERLFHLLDGDGLTIDRSGVGRPVVDELRARGVKVTGVTFTGGNSEAMIAKVGRRGEDWNVSRSILLANLAAVIHAERLKISAGLALTGHLLRELEDLESRVSAAGRESIEVASTAEHNADVVVALALAVWRCEKPLPRPVRWARHDLLDRN